MEAIESVRQQTYANWEIILVDDGSTDNSRTIYQELEQDPKIHIFYNEKNMGCGYTKRRCAELANGEICGFLDPDDELLPHALSIMAENHWANPEVSIIYSKSYSCDKDKKIIGESLPLQLGPGETYFNNKNQIYGALNFASYKNSFYQLTEGISANIYAGVDQDLYFKVEEKGHPLFIDSITYRYINRNNNSITTHTTKLIFYNIEVMRNTEIRRNIEATNLIINRLDNFITDIKSETAYEVELKIRNSTTYKIGKLILFPFACIRNILHKIAKI